MYEGYEVAANQVLVKFRPTSLASVLQAQISEDVFQAEDVGGTGALRFRSASKGVAALIAELSARADVEYAEPNYIVHTGDAVAAIPNDPRFGELWGLQAISAVAAWDISTGSRTNVVGVVDTGIDYKHPDLGANVWSAPADFTVNVNGTLISCLAGSHGFNAISNTCDPLDDNNHGSHVSGTIGAIGNNGLGVVGVNWTVSMMGLKFLNSSGSGTISDAVKAVEFAIQAKAAFGGASGIANVRVLSNSWGGGGFSQAFLDEITRANSSDMLFVAAAGNNGRDNDVTPFYPASYTSPNLIAVAATTQNDSLASFSNYGATSVHLGAPGLNILSTTRGDTYSSFSGTSMATPHLSGAALLILSACALDTAGLKTVIVSNVDLIPAMAGITTTGGRLNVNAAIRACAVGPDFSLTTSTTTETVVQGDLATFTANVTPSGGFAGNVTLSVSGLPAGTTADFTPNPTTDTSTLTITTSGDTSAGSYILTFAGVSGTISHTTSVTLVVTPL